MERHVGGHCVAHQHQHLVLSLVKVAFERVEALWEGWTSKHEAHLLAPLGQH